MRIISGKWKGRRFTAPKNLPTRPTTDFAKEALFNILNHRFYLNEIKVLDLFAGIGSISLEFLSRGAQHVDAVEENAKCVSFIYETMGNLDIKNLQTHKQDVFKFIEKERHATYDLIFADPPFDMAENLYNQLIDSIFENNFLEEGGCFVLEHSGFISFENHPKFAEHKKYGNVNFSFFEEEFLEEE